MMLRQGSSRCKPAIYNSARFFSSALSPWLSLKLSEKENGSHVKFNEVNETQLHHAIMYSMQLNDIQRMEDEVGTQAMSDMAKVVSDRGKLPIDYYGISRHYDISMSVLMKMYRYLLDASVAPMNEKINVDSVMQSFYSKSNPQLNLNLQVACEAADYARSVIRRSTTHPDANDYLEQEVRQTNVSLAHVRGLAHKKIKKAKRKHGYRDGDSQLDMLELESVNELCLQTRIGNCSEFTSLVMYYIATHFPGITSEYVYVDNGDHVVAVINRPQETNIELPNTWGDKVVVCDSFVGDIYPSTELNKHLLDFRYIETEPELGVPDTINVLTSYNPRFHKLASSFAVNTAKLECSRKSSVKHKH